MIKITSDSTADLDYLFASAGIDVMPLFVTLDGQEYEDGVSITPQMIFDKYSEKKILPKTAARSIDAYSAFFAKALENSSQIIHFCISSELSASYNNARLAANEFNTQKKRIFVVDSRMLSTGIGLLVLKAVDLKNDGKPAEEIYERICCLAPKVQTSFVVDTMEFLHKGGRCSSLTKILAGILKIRPVLQLKNGKIEVTRKFSGSYVKSVSKYVEQTLKDYPTPDYTRIFITHTYAEQEIVDNVKAQLKELAPEFKNIIETKAGSTVTAHCGKGTLGILYINEPCK